jgi:biotin carboxyl carrier protein
MKLKINIDGKQYEADIEVIEEERAEPVGAPPARASRARSGAKAPVTAPQDSASPGAGSGANVCKSSIVGIVVKIVVAEGQSVKQGETMLVLEAMKMESNVVAPVTGVVKSVLVAAGDSVKKGQTLVEFA